MAAYKGLRCNKVNELLLKSDRNDYFTNNSDVPSDDVSDNDKCIYLLPI
jgi:hypothetical protein